MSERILKRVSFRHSEVFVGNECKKFDSQFFEEISNETVKKRFANFFLRSTDFLEFQRKVSQVNQFLELKASYKGRRLIQMIFFVQVHALNSV